MRGGRRPGSGRKKGSGHRKQSATILKKAFDEGIMPLELLISEMRRLANEGTEAGLKEARLLAQAAAPYCHPRLQAIMANVTARGDTLSALLREIDGRTTGIANGSDDGEPMLEVKQPLSLPN
jgi:hypothetical protein